MHVCIIGRHPLPTIHKINVCNAMYDWKMHAPDKCALCSQEREMWVSLKAVVPSSSRCQLTSYDLLFNHWTYSKGRLCSDRHQACEAGQPLAY